MRVEYVGKSVADLDVNVRSGPSIQCGFTYGLRFRKYAHDDIFKESVTSINPAREEDADILVLDPHIDDDPYELIVVVVDQKCLQNRRLYQWLNHALTSDPDAPSTALMFVPEAQPGETRAAHILGKRLNRERVVAEACSYYPTLVE
ncbi:hypothetical protein [Paenarthrobacter aurescens]|uniref:hypothetical protein n=1 Tax=Paenarthrobacter aurescens TaxID=43663 RepID=UPI0021C17F46|nr:hypothetical protein [Paenarthrobacter aurescens]MCT9870801.1 hypothetical protein [Paenarthrobacter aurescens]